MSAVLGATLAGIAEVAFCWRPLQGILVLAALALVAPWSAAGALVGALAGTLASRALGTLDDAAWRAGLGGYNPAIVGIAWGGALARADLPAALLPLALAAVIALDAPLRRWLERRGVVPVSAAAVLVAWASHVTFAAFGRSLWGTEGLLPLGVPGLLAAVALTGAALAWAAPAPALFTVALTGAVWLGWQLTGLAWPPPAGLWAWTVAPAAFGASAVFLAGSRAGLVAGVAAGVLGGALWMLWTATGLDRALPPLLAPYILGLWAALALARRRWGPAVTDPALARAAGVLRGARQRGAPAVALTGAGVSTASGIPDYVSGAWIDPGVTPGDLSWASFLGSPFSRRSYWNACARFRGAAAGARPNAAHLALAALERRGRLAAVVTQNVDGLHQAAGSRTVVELHGNIGRARCLGCGRDAPWPNGAAPGDGDPRCRACGGLVKPAVVAMGEPLPPDAWAGAARAVARAGALLVAGTQVGVSSAAALLASARANGATVIFVTTGAVAQPVAPDDVVLAYPAEDALPALALLLDCGSGARRSVP